MQAEKGDMEMAQTALGVFNDWDQARIAVDRLLASGFSREEISIFARDESGRAVEMQDAIGDKAEQGALLGTISGSALGAAGGWALGLSALMVPGLGAAVIAGPIIGAFAGMLAGAGAGGLIGALIGSGVPEDRAAIYEEAIRSGEILVAVHHTDRLDDADRLLLEMGATHTRSHFDGVIGAPNRVLDAASRNSQAALIGTMAASPGGIPSQRDTPLEVPGAHSSGFLPTTGPTDGTVIDRATDADLRPGGASAWDTASPTTDTGARPAAVDGVEQEDATRILTRDEPEDVDTVADYPATGTVSQPYTRKAA